MTNVLVIKYFLRQPYEQKKMADQTICKRLDISRVLAVPSIYVPVRNLGAYSWEVQVQDIV